MIRPTFSRNAAISLLALAIATPSLAQPQPAPAPISALIANVNIPYEQFTLANGLTVLIHTDRKAPIVGVTTYYRVGSKNEPEGRTGFAHLFEHLFFGGSANAPSFDEPLEAAGAGNNGSTWYDRTNYVETVPTGALPLALFLESDRMGHLLGAVTQDKLDKQRGVVENEKRQDDNQPYALTGYATGEALFPIGHPYHHATIGSMADIDAASLPDVRDWYRAHYAPNNAILVLSGDIDAATAKPLVEHYYAAIPPGPKVAPVTAGPITLPAPLHREMTDQVATLRLTRAWSGPGLNHPDTPALEIAMTVLGGLASSRLDNTLVRGAQLATGVSADDDQHEQVGILTATMDVRPGVPRAQAETAFDAEIAKFLTEGPTPDELQRAVTRTIADQIAALEVVGGFGGKGSTLAEGLLYSNDPAHYRKELAEIAALTPTQVRDAARRWLSRPAVMIAVTPGPRTEDGATMGGWGDNRPAPPKDPHLPVPPVNEGAPIPQPPVTPPADLTWPTLEHATLTNGIPVTLARRTAIPRVLVQLDFNAGVASDAQEAPGRQGLMLAMLTQGTAGATPRDATAVLSDEERLGATIATGESMDASSITLAALTPNLAPSLALLADIIRHPAFAASDLTRLQHQRLAEIAQAQTTPTSMAIRALGPLLFGPGHPYAAPADGLGTPAAITAETPQTIASAHARWLRPQDAAITVVGDITMAQLLPLLNARFGDWHSTTPAPAPQTDQPAHPHAHPAHRPDRPPGQPAIGHRRRPRPPHAGPHPIGPHRRRRSQPPGSADTGQRRPRQRFPLAPQLGPARGQRLVLRRQRRHPPTRRRAQPDRPRPRPDRSHRRRHHPHHRRHEGAPHHPTRHPHRAHPRRRRQHPRPPRRLRDQWRAPRRDRLEHPPRPPGCLRRHPPRPLARPHPRCPQRSGGAVPATRWPGLRRGRRCGEGRTPTRHPRPADRESGSAKITGQDKTRGARPSRSPNLVNQGAGQPRPVTSPRRRL